MLRKRWFNFCRSGVVAETLCWLLYVLVLFSFINYSVKSIYFFFSFYKNGDSSSVKHVNKKACKALVLEEINMSVRVDYT